MDVADLLLVLSAYGTNTDGDCNGDGATDVADLLIVLSQFNAVGCSPSSPQIVTITTSHCSPMSLVVAEGMDSGRVGDCMVNVDQVLDPSSSLGGCGGHGADDGYCELQGNQVRACFHDRCWGEDAQQCGDFGTTSSIDLWMDVLCEISDHVIPHETSWIDYQLFGPSGITAITGENSLESNGWVLNNINDWASCDGATPGPIHRCDCGCNSRGIGEYAGFWCGGEWQVKAPGPAGICWHVQMLTRGCLQHRDHGPDPSRGFFDGGARDRHAL